MSFSVIIPSRNASNLVPCVEAVRRAEPTAEIIVVDDGIAWSEAYQLQIEVTAAAQLSGTMGSPAVCKVIPGIKPFVFARNVNLGIQACAGDVVLLNDDALLQTPFGFHEMEEASRAHPEFGVISAVTNVVGNLAQRPQDMGLREEPRMVCFVCVYIPRATIDRVGLLDEEFTGYGFEDDSYCLRTRRAGLKIGIFDDCFVDHSSLKSSFRGSAAVAGDLRHNEAIFRAKYGAGNREL